MEVGTDKPLEGVTVLIRQNEITKVSQSTNENGYYKSALLDKGEYEVECSNEYNHDIKRGIAVLLKKTEPAPTMSLSTSNYSDNGVIINGVKWATRNVDKLGTFATKPEAFGTFYQWNRILGWSTTDPMINSNGGNMWDSNTPTGYIWEKHNDPSPAGWRVPTHPEIDKLLDTDKVSNEWTTINGISGIKFKDKATGNSLFLPAAGRRSQEDGMLNYSGSWGFYWSSAPSDQPFAEPPEMFASGMYFYFRSASVHNDSGSVIYSDVFSRGDGFSVRSVAE